MRRFSLVIWIAAVALTLPAWATADPVQLTIRDGRVTLVAAILYDRGERAKASDVIDGLLTEEPSNVDGLVLKARMSLGDSDVAHAREYAHRAASMAPNAAAVREVLAAIDSDR